MPDWLPRSYRAPFAQGRLLDSRAHGRVCHHRFDPPGLRFYRSAIAAAGANTFEGSRNQGSEFGASIKALQGRRWNR